MSSDTDHPRQRTVAELLAAHGDGNVSGRRRRRREPDDPDEGAHGAPVADPPEWRPAPPREPERPAAGDNLPPTQREQGRRRAGGAEPRNPEPRNPEPRDPDLSDSGRRDSSQRESGPWESDPWDPKPWDSDWHENAGWDAEPGQPSRSGPPREAPYPDTEARESRPRRAQREPEDREPAPETPSREPSRSWDSPGAQVRAGRDREAPPWEPRAAEHGPNGHETRSREPQSWDSPPPEAPAGRAVGAPLGERPPVEPLSRRAAGPPPLGERAPAEPLRDRPTEEMPRVRDTASADPGLTRPIQQQRRRRPEPDAEAPEPGRDQEGGPATMVGAAPVGSEAWHRARTDGRRRQPDVDGPDPGGDDDGQATMVAAAPGAAEAWRRSRMDGRRGAADGGPPTEAAAPLDFDDDEDDVDGARGDYPAGLGRRALDEEATGFFAPDDGEPQAPVKRRSALLAAKEEAGGPAWAAVIAQWIAGAIGGAALWVGFRFLWRDLPVVALAAAVLVTVGLVVVVRALLRSNDLRTTLFAVLVGLLLTVSPAILVLLGR